MIDCDPCDIFQARFYLFGKGKLTDAPHEWNDLGQDQNQKSRLDDLYKAACSDGWNPEILSPEIKLLKRRQKFIFKAETGLDQSNNA